ncbi:MAG: DoxX family protein [Actinomycetota bacterium]
METIIFIGRIAFSLMFIGSGVGHLAQTADTAKVAEARGLPNATLMAQISGVCLLAGGVAVILGIWIDLALLLISILVLIIAFLIHPFWKDSGDKQITEMSMFMKNLTIAGAAFVMFGFFGAGWNDLMITDPVFELGR